MSSQMSAPTSQRLTLTCSARLPGSLPTHSTAPGFFELQVATQRELRDSVQTVRAVFDAMTEGILVTDMMGRITDLNEAALRLYGYGGVVTICWPQRHGSRDEVRLGEDGESTNQSLVFRSRADSGIYDGAPRRHDVRC